MSYLKNMCYRFNGQTETDESNKNTSSLKIITVNIFLVIENFRGGQSILWMDFDCFEAKLWMLPESEGIHFLIFLFQFLKAGRKPAKLMYNMPGYRRVQSYNP